MDKELLKELKESSEKYGEYIEIDENLLYVTDRPTMFGIKSCICYGPLVLWCTCAPLESMAVAACTETDEGEVIFAGFMCKDNFGDLYTYPIYPANVEVLRNIVADPDILFSMKNVDPSNFVDDWMRFRDDFKNGKARYDEPKIEFCECDENFNPIMK